MAAAAAAAADVVAVVVVDDTVVLDADVVDVFLLVLFLVSIVEYLKA